MKTIGITGGIGSGKTFVSSYLKEKYNIPVYDVDVDAVHLLNDGRAYGNILWHFGSESFINGKYNKEYFKELFADNEYALKLMNTILLPLIRDDIKTWIARMKDENHSSVLVISPLMIETNLDIDLDEFIYIDCPYDLRIQRLVKRGTSLKLIDTIIGVQEEDLSRMKYKARFILKSIDPETTRKDLDLIHASLLK